MSAPTASKKRVITVLLALSCLGSGQDRPAARFEGKSIPDPPRQKEPWTPPATKIPRFLVAATAALFEDGMADPRGCEYREVEIGDGRAAKARGFVLPRREGEADRFVVSWDGVIHPAISVGAAADIAKDVRADVEPMRRSRQGVAGHTAVFSRGAAYEWAGPGQRAPTALKVCLLLRLGRAELAEELFAAATTWTPGIRGRDLTDYGVSYLTMAQDWASIVFLRLIYAHMGGDDAIALDAARRLSAFARSAGARAEALGFAREVNRFTHEPPSYFPFLRQLPVLLADQERRAKEPARGPIPPRGTDPAARVAALIRELDQIAHRQEVHFGNGPDSPLVPALIAEGDAAIEPLLAAIETDTRLTRTTTRGRDVTSVEHRVHPVLEPEYLALMAILKADQSSGISGNMAARKELAQSMRDFWIKNRAVPLTERWYQTLRDDGAGLRPWMAAAANIVQPGDAPGSPVVGGYINLARPSAGPVNGEELRSRHDPSVSQLIARRALETARAPRQRTIPDVQLEQACKLAMMLHRWDPKAALPVLRTLTAQALEVIALNRSEGHHRDQDLVDFIAQAADIRVRAGEREALAEYAAEIVKNDPQYCHMVKVSFFEPLWTYPDDPAIRDAARRLFNDPQSPWTALLCAPGSRTSDVFQDADFFTSPLVRSAGFRDGVLAALTIKTEMGTVRRGEMTSTVQGFDRDGRELERKTVRHEDQARIEYQTRDGNRGGFIASAADLQGVEPDRNQPFRVCDYIAWQLSTLEGSPRFELYWPEARRDQAVEACAAYLMRYGDRFTADAPVGEPESPGSQRKRAHLAFPKLDRPATPDDVRAVRAIFSLEGQGEVRQARLAALPIKARWVKLEDDSKNEEEFDLKVRRELNQQGWIWQAEEVRKGDRWERYYGFVGRHVVARVPAAEIEQATDRANNYWVNLASGLDARIEPIARGTQDFRRGEPIVMDLRMRNRRGVENASPREFLRRGVDGWQALRRGVSFSVTYLDPKRTRSEPVFPTDPSGEELKPKRTDRFEPAEAARPLGPFEEFRAMQLDLNDWFDLSRPGRYYAQLKFSADSGVGEGTTNSWYFTVGEREGFLP